MTVDWPLAIGLAIVFVVLSLARWRWFKARMNRAARTTKREGPPRT